MKRYEYLAAEIFGYSYRHYQDKIEMENSRFTKYMPSDVKLLEQGIKEAWSTEKIAEKLEIDAERVGVFKEAYERAVKIVDQLTPYRTFEEGIKATFNIALGNNPIDDLTRAQLLEQFIYRAKDFEFLLREELELLATSKK